MASAGFWETGSVTADSDLREALDRIAALDLEVARLNDRLADQRSIEALRTELVRAASLGQMRPARQDSALIEGIVLTAMRSLTATAASLYLVDGEELLFEVALGPSAEGLVGKRIPANRGIAGWVAATGQGIAVTDVQNDSRWARDIAQGIGYAPSSMAVAPLLSDEEVIGVLQLLDRQDGRPFDNTDLELLGEFARLAGNAVAQSRQLGSISLLLRAALHDLADPAQMPYLLGEANQLSERLQRRPEFVQTMEIAALLGRISESDEEARELCLAIAGAFASYLDRRRGYEVGRGY
jgi:GAF domain-containing protein